MYTIVFYGLPFNKQYPTVLDVAVVTLLWAARAHSGMHVHIVTFECNINNKLFDVYLF